jgi:hypothetical protein
MNLKTFGVKGVKVFQCFTVISFHIWYICAYCTSFVTLGTNINAMGHWSLNVTYTDQKAF